MQPLFNLQAGVSHPLCLVQNMGFEIQRITAAAGQDISYLVAVEWAEVTNL
jgi:hypothetical protein